MIRMPRIGRYEVSAVLGGGRWGDVFLAYDPLLDINVALKRSRQPAEVLKEALSEARMIARLHHPNIVRFYTAEIIDGYVVIVMEYLEGTTLRRWMNERKKVTVEEALDLMIPILEGLAHAHELNIVHRDVKPENILMTKDARVAKLADFGLATFYGLQPDQGPTGTPAYMAPEAWEGKFSPASDVFSCAVILYEMTTGVNPLAEGGIRVLRSEEGDYILFCVNAEGDIRLLRPPEHWFKIGDFQSKSSGYFVSALEQALHPDWRHRPKNARDFLARLRPESGRKTTGTLPLTGFDWNAVTVPDELLSALSEFQRAIVKDRSPRIAVFGGPGTGKTLTLAAKVVHLVHNEGWDPEKFVITTFTTKGWKDLAFRLERALGPRAKRLALYNFHTLCWKILVRDAERLPQFGRISGGTSVPYPEERPLEILPPEKLHKVAAEVAKQAKTLRSGRYLYDYLSRFRLSMKSKNDLRGTVPNDLEKDLIRFWDHWESHIVRSGRVSYDDVIYYTYLLLSQNQDLARQYSESIRFFFVDEYQDFTPIEVAIARALAGQETQWVVFGDPNQSIYTWRGASPEFLIRFEKEEPNTRVYHLNVAYRLPRKMVKLAQALMRDTDLLLPGSVVDDGDIQVVALDRAQDIGEYLTREIRRLHKAGYDYCDMAVLYRYAVRSRIVEDALTAAQIPYTLMFQRPFLHRPEIRGLLTVLRALRDPHDKMAEKEAVEWLEQKISSRARASRPGTARQRQNRAGGDDSQHRVRPASPGGEALFDEAKNLARGSSAKVVLEFLADRLGYRVNVERTASQQSVQELISLAANYEAMAGDEGSVSGFLAHLNFAMQSDPVGGEDAVNLATVHSAKGLEFPVVFLIGLVEGEFPRDTIKPEELAEERRLFLVGVTRARERLYLCYHRKDESGRATEPSRFIRETIVP